MKDLVQTHAEFASAVIRKLRVIKMNWYKKPCKVEVKHDIGGDRPGKSYDIGNYVVTVYDDKAVEYTDKREQGDPKHALPNMEIRDGEIRILVSDLAGEALKRMEPEDLARSLWQHEDVRKAFMDCLVRRYNEEGIGDEDRRTFLEGVKAAVHSKALDGLAKSMSGQEYSASKRSFFYHEVNRINEMLRVNECKNFRGEQIQLPQEDSDPDFKIAGKHWNESREFWRLEVLKQFPLAQTLSEEPALAGDTATAPDEASA